MATLYLLLIIPVFISLELSHAEFIYWDDSNGDPQSLSKSATTSKLRIQSSKDVAKVTAIDPLPAVVEVIIVTNNLIEFPDFSACCASTILEIDLYDNKITTIDPARINILTSVTRIWIHQNQLTSFPDVSGPGGSLIELAISDNMFTTIPSFSNYPLMKTMFVSYNPMTADVVDLSTSDIGPNLEVMALDGINAGRLIASNPTTSPTLIELRFKNNNLVEFPEISALAGSLTTLLLSGNKITDLVRHSDRLASLTNLANLEMKDNGLSTFGNICRLPQLTTFSLVENQFHCDCKMRWLKAADLISSTPDSIIVDSCVSPPEMTVGNWDDQKLEDFNCNEWKRSFTATKLHHVVLYYELPLVVGETTTAYSVVDCAGKCMSTKKCLFIRFFVNNGDNVCVLMIFDMSNGSWVSSASFEDWYIIE